MERQPSEQPTLGQITAGIEPEDTLALQTIRFISKQLPAWRDDPDRPQEESEKRLNPQLCKFLGSRGRNEFPMVCFFHEEPQIARRSADLSASPVEATQLEAKAYTIYDPILTIECKRLPAPSKDREKEYVTGGPERNGGIQRFKLGLYATEHDLAVMIGYVQQHDGHHWQEQVNEWISELATGPSSGECVWTKDECLDSIEENTADGLSMYRSIHNRVAPASSNEIGIRHLWIVMDLTSK